MPIFIGQCLVSEVAYMIYTTFWELSYTFRQVIGYHFSGRFDILFILRLVTVVWFERRSFSNTRLIHPAVQHNNLVFIRFRPRSQPLPLRQYKSDSIMTTNHVESGLDSPPRNAVRIKYTQAVSSIQYNIGILNQSLSQTFRVSYFMYFINSLKSHFLVLIAYKEAPLLGN